MPGRIGARQALSTECFHSRDEQPYWITETKESICIKIEFNSLGISLEHHHGRRDVT